MANFRTVDPTGKTSGTAIIALRLTVEQMKLANSLSKERGINRSALFRQLLAEEITRVEGTR